MSECGVYVYPAFDPLSVMSLTSRSDKPRLCLKSWAIASNFLRTSGRMREPCQIRGLSSSLNLTASARL